MNGKRLHALLRSATTSSASGDANAHSDSSSKAQTLMVSHFRHNATSPAPGSLAVSSGMVTVGTALQAERAQIAIGPFAGLQFTHRLRLQRPELAPLAYSYRAFVVDQSFVDARERLAAPA